MAQYTTRELWRDFTPYSIKNRGERNVPTQYLQEARWGTIRGVMGCFMDIPSRLSWYYPVEFNFKHTCWCEVQRNESQNQWDITRPTNHDFCCNILKGDVVT